MSKIGFEPVGIVVCPYCNQAVDFNLAMVGCPPQIVEVIDFHFVDGVICEGSTKIIPDQDISRGRLNER